MKSTTTLAATVAIGAMLAASAAQAQAQAPAPYTDTRTGQYLQAGGDRIFYQVQGHGPVMLLIHGFPLSGDLFRGQLDVLSHYYTVVTPDLPGFGKSISGSRYQTEEHYAHDMFAVLDAVGSTKAIIGGHSMGGQVTLEMYREQPDRFRGMILFDTNPAPASIVEQAEFPAYGLQAEQHGSASIAPPITAVMATGDSLIADPELGALLTGIVTEAAPTGVLAAGIALATRYDYRPLLPRIKVPALVVVGTDDPVYPYPISDMLQAKIPGSTLATITGAAHASMFQRPAVANHAIYDWAAAAGLNTTP